MNQVNENLIVLNPGDQNMPAYDDCLKIYLSGSLDISGNGLTWQEKFTNGLSKMTVPHPEAPNLPDYSAFKFVVINPLSPQNGPASLDNPEYAQKIQWCLQWMGQADVIFCNFLRKSTKLSAIQDLLLWAQSGKIVARCPADSVFYGYIKTLSGTFNFPVIGDSSSVIAVMDTIFNGIPKFQELKQFGI